MIAIFGWLGSCPKACETWWGTILDGWRNCVWDDVGKIFGWVQFQVIARSLLLEIFLRRFQKKSERLSVGAASLTDGEGKDEGIVYLGDGR